MKLKHKKQSRIDKLGESLSELHGDLEVHKHEFIDTDRYHLDLISLPAGKNCAKEERRREKKQDKHTNQQLRLINKPKGRAGQGSGYKLIDALGLTEKKDVYNHLSDVVWKLVYRYLDTSHLLSHQSDKLLVEKVIQRAQAESEILMQCEGGCGACALIAQVLENQSTSEQRQKQNAEARRKREESNDKDEEEVGTDDAGANRCIKHTSGTQKKRKRDKSESESKEVDTDDASDNRHIKCTSGTHKKRKRFKSKSKSDSESESEEMDTGNAGDNRHIKCTSDTQKKRKRDNSQSKSEGNRKMERDKDDDDDDDEDDNNEDEDERSVYPKCTEARQKMCNDDIQPNMHAKGDKGHQCLGGTQKHFREREMSWWMNQLMTSNHAYYKQQMACWEWNDRNLSAMGHAPPRPLTSVWEQADEAEVPAASECHDGSQKKKRNDMCPLDYNYGNKGAAIIEHTLIALFLASAELTAAIWPLLLAHPTTVVKAHKIMVASSDAGSLIHPTNDDDTELEEIFHRNIDAAQALLELQEQTQKASPTLSSCTDDSNQAANKLHSEQAKVNVHYTLYPTNIVPY
ncbi:hypothetical protein F5J12DRAFT_898092 [Pisolithus orientalis]|uniref:uncharacterized protein n=1 Tax=Pisolithus orientalis TaxID=936130 RepID=UPI0022252FD1|nr:uncharacterized protein F5J12DRAFT_898092 [Pisolithus orientalis]KAI5988846.1 hypothetical protein F5J12DRAFT_898092 [Pisolithus orientalis]